jgi:hypothetical protein
MNAVTGFLAVPGVRELFSRRPGRVALSECEIVRRDGRLFRVDRIVVDPGLVRVVDFKTGGDAAESVYREQVRNYVDLVGEIYPGHRVEGYLGYVDRQQLRQVV